MHHLAGYLAGLAGWRRYAAAWLFGALATAALPPLQVEFILLISFPGLAWVTRGPLSRRQAFWTGWWFGFGHFTTGLYWLSNALLIDPVRFGWLIPFAVFGLPAVLGVFPGLVTLIDRWLGRSGAERVLVFALAWTAMEWLRGHILTGFPWNLIGYAWMERESVVQIASLIGAYGLSFLTVAAAMSFAALAEKPGRAWVSPAVAVLGLVAIAVWGGQRLAANPTETVADVRLRLVQGNVGQTDKWRDDYRAAALARYREMSAQPAAKPPTHVIWPETAVPYLVTPDATALRQAIGEAAPPGGVVLAGAPRAVDGADGLKLWNSVLAVNRGGEVVATYDKSHLVPFGEYLPLRWLLSPLGIDKIVYGPVDFSPGPGLETLTVPGAPPVGPLVCYEGIFPGRVARDDARPAWLLNVSNDGWYGDSAGPYQHLAMARLRSIEEGLPLVRAANTGVSAVVDPFGRVLGTIGYNVQAVLDSDLPKAIPPTIYARYGDLVPLLAAVLLTLVLLARGVMVRTVTRPAGS